MWCQLERRDVAGAAAAYDPRARQALGKVLDDTLEVVRRSRVYRRASIVDVQQSEKLGPRAIVRVGAPGHKVIRGWYRLARRGSGWAITWDTTLRYAIHSHLNPGDSSLQPRGGATSVPRFRAKRDEIVAAVARYDALFLSDEAPGDYREGQSAG